MRILVCDDEETQYKAAKRLIPKAHDVEGLFEARLSDALSDLFRGAVDFLNGSEPDLQQGTSKAFGGYDLAIVDNDLSVLKLDSAPLSAEGLIGYFRAFADIPYIVSLNKNQDVDFDLRGLFGDDRSQADLAINTDHLKCKRLWAPAEGEQFAPWYWPNLPDAVRRRRDQIKFVRDRLDSPIWDALGFPDLATEYLSRRAKEALLTCGNDQTIKETTFREFFDGTPTLLPRQKQVLGQSADGSDPCAVGALSRVVASDLDRWIRRDVLGEQDVLIDLPHLVARMPYLLGDRAGDLARWNEAAHEADEPFGIDSDLYESHVRDAHFQYGMWAPSPCFWWPTLRQNRELNDLFFSADDWPDGVFCEDSSVFVSVEAEEAPREIEVDMEGSWPRRHIMEVAGRQYVPRSRVV